MKRDTKKRIIFIFVIIAVLIYIIIITQWPKYNEKWIIGKTSREIQGKYGTFDVQPVNIDIDDIYRNTEAGYVLVPEKVGLLGTEPAEILYIYFDEDGIAYKCVTKTEPLH